MPPPVPLTFHIAATPVDRLTAARLRAAAFAASLPPTASPYARRAYVATRTAAAWDALEARAAGADADWAGVSLTTLLAAVDGGDGAGAGAVDGDGDGGVILVTPAPPPLLAIASVDVNGGARLPCERLVAPAPPDGGGLAYLSNVAVAPAFRGRGVGAALLAHALATAAAGGASRVAVHAELRNAAAVALYGRLFGAARVVEPLAVEAAAGRARRALFWVDV